MVKLALVCAIVGVAESVFPVDIDDSMTVWQLKNKIAETKPDTIKCAADKLQLFLAKKDGEWLTDDDTLDAMLLGGADTSTYMMMHASWKLNKQSLFAPEGALEEDVIHVLVVVPPPDVGSKRSADDEVANILKRLKFIERKTLTEFTPLSVNEDEFRLDSLSMTRQRDDPIVMTPTLHEFWKEFGEFPPYYFVRMEEVVF